MWRVKPFITNDNNPFVVITTHFCYADHTIYVSVIRYL